MLSEFEIRLANVLGARLPAPLTGTVAVAPGVSQSRVLVAVRSVSALDQDLLSLRPEQVPGAAARRRVLRLRCTVGLEFRQPQGSGRADAMRALDQTVYLLGDAAFRDGSALLPADNSDPGFLIRRMMLLSAEPPTTALLDTEGLFWPVGVIGEDGRAITRARIRSAFLPVRLSPAEPRITAGGEAEVLHFEFGTVGTMEVAAAGVTQSAFGSVVVSLVDEGGRPGAGTLAGGVAGPAGSRLLPVAAGAASIQYTPPAEPAVDHLVIALEGEPGEAGIELARFRLRVRGP